MDHPIRIKYEKGLFEVLKQRWESPQDQSSTEDDVTLCGNLLIEARQKKRPPLKLLPGGSKKSAK